MKYTTRYWEMSDMNKPSQFVEEQLNEMAEAGWALMASPTVLSTTRREYADGTAHVVSHGLLFIFSKE